jgi:NADH-quinone oxidoreductase subunit J
MISGNLFFDVTAIIVIATAIGMLVSRNAIYSALFLVLNFASVALLYVTLGAPFIAMAQVTVYAGAIMILFLFVIMLLGAEKLPADGVAFRGERLLAIILAVVFLGEATWLLIFQSGVSPLTLGMPASEFASPAAVGLVLFSKYLLPFEITSIILLVALIGAIVLTKTESSNNKIVPLEKE